MSKYYSQPLRLTLTRGFMIGTKNPDKEEYGTDLTLEEIFAYYMGSHLEKQITGSVIAMERPDHIGSVASAVNRGRQRFDEVFKRKTEWIPEFQKFHRESDVLGFANFLAKNTTYIFESNEQRDQYGLDLLMAFPYDPTGVAYNDFLSRMK